MSNDTIYGGPGDDTIFGGVGDDLIAGGLGADLMDGGTGTDRLSYYDATSRVVVDMLNGTVLGSYAAGDVFSNFENLEGGLRDDLLLGDNADNLILGGGNTDELQGRFGDDTLEGGAGADTLDGGGNIDTAAYSGSNAGVSVNLFNGSTAGGHAVGDIFLKIDNLIGSDFDDNLVGTFTDNVLEGGIGADTLNGGAGRDTVSYAADTTGVVVSLETGATSGGHAAGDVILNFENLRDGSGADALTGDADANYLWGGAGIDTLTGRNGDDTLEGGEGADILQGNGGSDWAAYADSPTAVQIDLKNGITTGGDATGDILTSIENLLGSDYADALTGDNKDNTIEGGAGADALDGSTGTNTVSYANSDTRVVVDLLNGNTFLGHAEGNTIINFENLTGSRLPDYLLGSNNNNVLTGGAGINRLEARGGDDTLIGGTQNDNLKGGAGADVFVLNIGDGADLIADWEDGSDQIDVSDFGLIFSQVLAAASQLPIGALLIDFGGGDSFQINNFALADFDSGDVIA